MSNDLVFPRGRPDFQALVVLDLADLRDNLGAAIEQADEVLIKPVDLGPETGETRLALGVGRLGGRGPILRGTGGLIAC